MTSARDYIATHGTPGDIAIVSTRGLDIYPLEPRDASQGAMLATAALAWPDATVSLARVSGPWGRRVFIVLRWPDDSVALVLAEPLP